MTDWLINTDTEILLAINGAHSAYFDEFMWLVSKTIQWWIVYATILALIYRCGWRKGLVILAGVAFVVIFSDQISSSLLKPFFQRLRPSHNPDIENLVHIVNDSRGGLYGFVSSHAANTFGVATFVALVFRHKGITPVIYFWPMLVSYSRIYLAKHYLGDIIGGAIVGVLVASAVYLIITVKTKDLCVDTRLNYGKFMLVAIIANVLYISVMACFYVL